MDAEKVIKAGKIAAMVRDETVKRIVAGASFSDILDFCEGYIVELGGGVAWAQISPTTTAAHFSPTSVDNPICKYGDLLKLDVGVHIDGYIADTAFSVLIRDDSLDAEISLKNDLIKASLNALKSVGKIIEPGVKLRELGAAQHSEAEALGFTTVHNLCGHTVDRWSVHGGMSIPSYDNGSDAVLESNSVVAIEPFVTDGKGMIQPKGTATIFMQENERNTRSVHGRKLLAAIRERNGLPFATRDFEKQFNRATAVLGLRDLSNQGIIRSYPPLVEVSDRPVAQFEHSFLLSDDNVLNITKSLDEE